MNIEYNSNFIIGNEYKKIFNKDMQDAYLKNINNSLQKTIKKLTLDITKVETIFIEDDIQKKINFFCEFNKIKIDNCTNTKYGSTMGKTIHLISEDKFYIFINAMCLFGFKKDKLENSSTLQNIKNIYVETKELGILLLVHELSHCEMDSYSIHNSNCYFGLDKELEIITYRFFKEYYACRRSVEVYLKSVSIVKSEKEMILKLQEVLSTMYKKTINKTTKEMYSEFQKYIEIITNYQIYYLATNYNNPSAYSIYKGISSTECVKGLCDEFSKIYLEFKSSKVIKLSSDTKKLVKQIYLIFGLKLYEENGNAKISMFKSK